MLIHEHARGIPRSISVICDNALVSGMALGRQPVGRDIILEVCRDFDLTVGTDSIFELKESSPRLGQESDEISETAFPTTLGSAAESESLGEAGPGDADDARGIRPLGLGRR